MSRRVRVATAALATVAAAWLLVGGVPGLVVGLVAAPFVGRAVRRYEPARDRESDRAIVADLPFVADLLAAAMRAGAPTEHAVRVTAVSVGGPLGARLGTVADQLRLGLDPEDAWGPLRTPAPAARLADAVIRSADSGAAVARTLRRIADDLRAARQADVEAAAQRAGVLIVLPLGLCFLPAFVLAGIAPVIVAVLGDAL